MLSLALAGLLSAQTPDPNGDPAPQIVWPVELSEHRAGETTTQSSPTVAFWLDRGPQGPVALLHASSLLLALDEGEVEFDGEYGLWPDPFAYERERFRWTVGSTPLDGPAWAAWDWTFILAGRAQPDAAPPAEQLAPSLLEPDLDSSLAVTYLDQAGQQRRSPLTIRALPKPDAEEYWIQVEPAGAEGLSNTARVLGAPLLDANGDVVGVVGKREGARLFAQPIAEFLGAVPYWRPLWKHRLDTPIRDLDLSEDGSRLLLVGDGIEVLELDGLRILTRIDPLQVAEQLDPEQPPPDAIHASLTSDGQGLWLHWTGHLHRVSLAAVDSGSFSFELGPQFMPESIRGKSFHADQLDALGDRSVLLRESLSRPLRIGPRGGFALPAAEGARYAFQPERGLLIEGRGDSLLRFDLLAGRALPVIRLNEPVELGAGCSSPSGGRVAVSDRIEVWIDVLSPSDGISRISPDVTILPPLDSLGDLRLVGEDRLVAIGGNELPETDRFRLGDGQVLLFDAWSGQQLAGSGEFEGNLVALQSLPDGRLLVVSDRGELACFDPDRLHGWN